MKVQFTKNQFASLMKVVYLGNWLVNAIHSGAKGDERIKEFDEIEKYIFSFAKEFGLEKYVDFDIEEQRFFFTRAMDDLMYEFVEEYDEDNFWDEFFHRMSDRDFAKTYSPQEVMAMEIRERFEKEEPFRQKWDDEINRHGIERLEIRE